MGRVTIHDFKGNTLSSIWQYGQMDWELFYTCLKTVIFTKKLWANFRYEEGAPGKKGAICIADRNEYPTSGTYILLTPDGDPITVGLVLRAARARHLTVSTRTDSYQRRVRDRDPCCVITGLEVSQSDFSRFQAVHIFPRAHDVEWRKKGYTSLITDPAPSNEVGGPSKIDSIQNALLLRSDLHAAWNNYKFAVNPDRDYVVIPFDGGYEDIAGKILKLDHIEDPNHRPLGVLFRDHFDQCVLKNMKGAAEPAWDYEGALGGGSMDLSRQEVWASQSGKAHLEFEMAHRLHSLKLAQEIGL